MALAERGYRIHIISAEKPGRDQLMSRYQRLFAERDIAWSHVRYHNRPPLVSQFLDVARMKRLALRVARSERPRLVHCRSYLPIGIGLAVKRRTGAKLLIDFRHFWVEAGLEDSPFKFVYRAFKRLEPRYFAAADHVVTLTRRAARILDGWYPSKEGQDHYTVIPCCADFAHFDTRRIDPDRVATLRAKLGFGPEDTILLYLGSIGPDYLVEEMMTLFRELLVMRPGAKFLFVSNNGQERVAAVREALGISADAVRFVTVPRDDVPAYLKLSDLSVFFYRADLSRAGCSPTKLAELMAANVPVIGNTNVGDLDQILSLDRNCSVVVPDFEPATLRAALQAVLDVPERERLRIRDASHGYSLEEGAQRYADVYNRLIGPPPAVPAPSPAEELVAC